MSFEHEDMRLPNGVVVRTGLLPATDEGKLFAANAPMFGEEFYLEDADIKKLLPKDTHKMWRRRRSRWLINQNGLGSCNAAATVGAFQNRRDVEGLKHVPLSVNYLYMHINGGRDSGSTLAEGIKYAARGIAPVKLQVEGREWIFPHKSYRTSQISAAQMAAAKAEAANYVAHEAFKLPVGNYTMFKRAVASALARDFQIVHAWHVGGNSMSLRNGYIVQGRGPGNHATLGHSATYVGGEDIVHIDVQNSWCRTSDPIYGPTGSDWGEDGGFGLMTMQDFYACAKYHDYWVFTGSVKNEGSLV